MNGYVVFQNYLCTLNFDFHVISLHEYYSFFSSTTWKCKNFSLLTGQAVGLGLLNPGLESHLHIEGTNEWFFFSQEITGNLLILIFIFVFNVALFLYKNIIFCNKQLACSKLNLKCPFPTKTPETAFIHSFHSVWRLWEFIL